MTSPPALGGRVRPVARRTPVGAGPRRGAGCALHGPARRFLSRGVGDRAAVGVVLAGSGPLPALLRVVAELAEHPSGFPQSARARDSSDRPCPVAGQDHWRAAALTWSTTLTERPVQKQSRHGPLVALQMRQL